MPFNNSISKYDLQYLVTGFSLISVFIFTDLIGVIDKKYFYFVPKLISDQPYSCLLYTSPSPRDFEASRMPSSA